jgi:hypothetical protein
MWQYFYIDVISYILFFVYFWWIPQVLVLPTFLILSSGTFLILCRGRIDEPLTKFTCPPLREGWNILLHVEGTVTLACAWNQGRSIVFLLFPKYKLWQRSRQWQVTGAWLTRTQWFILRPPKPHAPVCEKLLSLNSTISWDERCSRRVNIKSTAFGKCCMCNLVGTCLLPNYLYFT